MKFSCSWMKACLHKSKCSVWRRIIYMHLSKLSLMPAYLAHSIASCRSLAFVSNYQILAHHQLSIRHFYSSHIFCQSSSGRCPNSTSLQKAFSKICTSQKVWRKSLWVMMLHPISISNVLVLHIFLENCTVI